MLSYVLPRGWVDETPHVLGWQSNMPAITTSLGYLVSWDMWLDESDIQVRACEKVWPNSFFSCHSSFSMIANFMV
jgi:hypothetical protein